MEEAQARDPAMARVRRDRGDSVDHAFRALPFVVHDQRDVMTEIAPGAREQHVLHGLAADVAQVAFARQHAVRVHADDADLAMCAAHRPAPAAVQPYGSRTGPRLRMRCATGTGASAVSTQYTIRITTPVYIQ